MSATDQQTENISVRKAMVLGKQPIADTVEIEDNAIYNLRLEEARHDAAQGEWLVTFAYDLVAEEPPGTALPSRNALTGLFPAARSVRVYRVIVLDDNTGEFKEVRRREPASEQ